jgi:hypothetical protein
MRTSLANERRVEVGDAGLAVAQGIRIDGAHVLGDGPASSPAPGPLESVKPAVGAASDDHLIYEQLRTQARQLVGHLASRQRQLDAREAKLNAQWAALENEIRNDRLWLLQRRAELADQAGDLVRRECDLSRRASHVSAAEAFLFHSQQQAEQHRQQQEEELLNRQGKLEAEAERLKGQRAALKQACRRLSASRRRQERSLRLKRQTLAAQQAAMQAMFRGLHEGIEARQARLARQEEDLIRREAATTAASIALSDRQQVLERDRQSLKLQSEAIDRRRLELEQVQHALRTMHQQALADRQLADQFRLAQADLARQRKELEQVRSLLAENHQRLAQQAARLAARERELNQQAF